MSNYLNSKNHKIEKYFFTIDNYLNLKDSY